jgi:hypothetical protein
MQASRAAGIHASAQPCHSLADNLLKSFVGVAVPFLPSLLWSLHRSTLVTRGVSTTHRTIPLSDIQADFHTAHKPRVTWN